MRSDPAQFDLVVPPTLEAALTLLASGEHTPIAGGTELMVAFNTGRLEARSLVSIQHLKELRFVQVEGEAIRLGAGTTYTDLRRHAQVCERLPLLAQAASWTGAVANQNRGTLGGNLCNASPAADTPPALLAYGATLRLVSAGGAREVPYSAFHLGYKRIELRPGELLHSVCVPVPPAGVRQTLRKVGTRQAQAISKVALASVMRLDGERLVEVRLGAASLADRPLRLAATEEALSGRSLAADELAETIRAGRAALAGEIHPIDDIRSTARYRAAVAGNLLEECLRLAVSGSTL